MGSNAGKIREWTTRFERFRRSAKTVSQFCRNEHVSIQAFYYWRDRVQTNSRNALQANSRNCQFPTTGNALVDNARAIGKTPAIGLQVVDSNCVRMIIRIGSISIECHAETSSAIDAVLSWAYRNQDGSFKQLIAR